MDVISIGLGLTVAGSIGLWGMLILSRNGDLRAEADALEASLAGESEATSLLTRTLKAEKESHADTEQQLRATENLVVDLADKLRRTRAGEDVGDIAVAGRILDRLLANADREDSGGGRSAAVPGKASTDNDG